MTRDERQNNFQNKFIAAGAVGCLEAVPGFGKTRVAANLITHLRRKKTDRTVLIVVPTDYLLQQWTEVLQAAGLAAHTSVRIINSAVKEKHDVDFLILDEIHRYASETFSLIFDQVKYKFILGLTGTIKRLDAKHTLLAKYCPVIDTVTNKEAKDNGWIAQYMEFNLAIEMPTADKDKYKKMDEQFDQYMDVFQWDFSLMMKCAKSYKPVLVKGGHADSACVTLAKEYGWTGFNADIAFDNLLAKKADIWGNLAHIYNPKSLFIRAINGMKTLRKMKAFVQNYQKKIDTAIEICTKVPVKTITFGESTVSADKITAALPLVSVSYHSKVPPLTHLGKRLNRKDTLKFLIEEIKAGRYTQVNTAKALDEGADFPEIQMGIRVSGTSASAQHKQRRGRITRKHGDKRAVMINLYVKGTKDEQWLTKSQGRDHGIIWVDTVEEIIELLDL